MSGFLTKEYVLLLKSLFFLQESKDRNGATIALLTGRLHNSDKAIKATKERCITLQNILFQLDVAVSK